MGRYVALEGVDGSGKSTIATALVERLEGAGNRVVSVREPGGTPVGEVVRGLLLDSTDLDHWAEVFLFAAQRAELASRVIGPALADGAWVVSDRSYYSSIAYQGFARGLGVDTIRAINELAVGKVVPDLVVVIDVDPASALARQDRPDRIGGEGVGFQSLVRSGYLELAVEEPERVKVVDGSGTVEEIVIEMMALAE